MTPAPIRQLRAWARRSPAAVALYLRWIGARERGVRPATDACIEGYPRSANTLTYARFMAANPGAVVAHHTHAAGTVTAAVRRGLPTLVLLRRPPAPILSALVAVPALDVADALARYVDFYREVERHREAVVLADFEAAVGDWGRVVGRLNARFGTAFAAGEEGDDGAVEAGIRSWVREHQDDDRAVLPLPTDEREAQKAAFRVAVEGHARYPEAVAVYERLRPAAVRLPIEGT